MTEQNAVQRGHAWAPEYERSYGFCHPRLRDRMLATRVCVAGAGGGGALLAQWAAREGYEVRVADPDVLDRSNGGRLAHAVPATWGRNKAEVVAERANQAGPAHPVTSWPEGITKANVEEFLIGGLTRDHTVIAVDEIDLLAPEIAALYASTARAHGIPVVTGTDIGYGGMVTCFDPEDRRHTYERVQGIADGQANGALNAIAYLPPYGAISTLESVLAGAPMPTTIESVLVTTALCLSELRRITAQGLPGYPKPTWAPRVRWLDCEWRSGRTRFPRVSHWRHLVQAALRDRVLSINPAAAYTADEIAERERFRSAATEANELTEATDTEAP